jgi:hypothetical protein
VQRRMERPSVQKIVEWYCLLFYVAQRSSSSRVTRVRGRGERDARGRWPRVSVGDPPGDTPARLVLGYLRSDISIMDIFTRRQSARTPTRA